MKMKVLNPQCRHRLYRDTEIAAIKHLADWLLRAGFTVEMGVDINVERFWLRAVFHRTLHCREDILVRASIRPHREGSGLWVTGFIEWGPTGRPVNLSFDGQDYMFMHDDAEGLVRFAEWFDENRYANS